MKRVVFIPVEGGRGVMVSHELPPVVLDCAEYERALGLLAYLREVQDALLKAPGAREAYPSAQGTGPHYNPAYMFVQGILNAGVKECQQGVALRRGRN